jgi:hypothetical protein
LDANKLLPIPTSVFGPIEMDGLDADVHDALIGRIHRHSPNVAFEDTPPALARVIGSIQAVLRDAQIDDVGPTA